jgi:hypothetical protein
MRVESPFLLVTNPRASLTVGAEIECSLAIIAGLFIYLISCCCSQLAGHKGHYLTGGMPAFR